MTFNEVVTMLCDRDGWRLAHPRLNGIDDEATYRSTGIYTYLECSGVKFRVYGNSSTEGNPVVYKPSLPAYAVISVLVGRLRRYLRRTQ